MPVRVHVASNHEILRKSMAAFLDDMEGLDVRRTSPEGATGVEEVRKTDADVLVLAVPLNQDIAAHAKRYREALPRAGIVGFAFAPEQGAGYRLAGIDRVVHVHDPMEKLIDAIHEAAPQ